MYLYDRYMNLLTCSVLRAVLVRCRQIRYIFIRAPYEYIVGIDFFMVVSFLRGGRQPILLRWMGKRVQHTLCYDSSCTRARSSICVGRALQGFRRGSRL